MKIYTNIEQFLLEKKENKNESVLYYAFDVDDNLLHLDTKIHMEKKDGDDWKPVDVSTSEFAKVRNDKENYRIVDNSFSEFRDDGPRGNKSFLLDVKDAIKNNEFGPSWDAFIECLVNGSIFMIGTARGHKSDTIKGVVEYVIDTLLTEKQKDTMYSNCLKFAYLFHETHHDFEKYPKIPKTKKFTDNTLIQDYLKECEYFGVSSDEFRKKFFLGDASNPEVAKDLALKYFADRLHNYSKKVGKEAKMGFSDDDKKTVAHVQKMFSNELALKYPIKLSIIDTSDRTVKGGVKTKINESFIFKKFTEFTKNRPY